MSFSEFSNYSLILEEHDIPEVSRYRAGSLVVYLATCFLVFLISILNYTEGTCWKARLKFRSRNVVYRLPGPRTFPFLGNIHQLLASKDILETFSEWGNQYGPCCRVMLGTEPIVVLTRAEAVEKLLSSNDSGHLSKSDQYDSIRDYLDEGLVTSNGEKWRQRRKLLSPSFSYKCFPHFLEVFNRHTKQLVSTIGEMYESDSEAKPVQNAIFESFLRVICETSMGVELTDNPEEFDKFFAEAERCKHYIWSKSVRPWCRVAWIWKFHPFRKNYEANVEYIKSYMFKVIREARKKFSASSDSENDFIMDSISHKTAMDVMLAKGFSDSDVREEAHTIISAGHETTAAAVQFALLLLALHPEHQKQCQDEIDEIYGDESKCPNGDFTMSSLSYLKHLDRCCKESLRIFPVANVTTRKMETPLKIDDNLELPAGTTCLIAATSIHRYPKYFPDPEKFDPSRFTTENCLGRPTYAYIPFSGGPRTCLGYKYALTQMKLVIARILHNFSVSTTDTINNVPLEPSIILTPKRGYNFVFKRRVHRV